jgi:riboflavin kinase/FMN adenylyltransferase
LFLHAPPVILSRHVKIIRDLAQWPAELRQGAVSVGNFDGVHLGHARIVNVLLAKAHAVGGPAVVFTFDPHPVRLLRPAETPPPLTWTARKAELLAELGIEAMVAYPTDEALLALSPAEFFSRIVLEKLAARAMVEGQNFFFGRDRTGNVDTLRQLTATAGLELEIVPPVVVDGEVVSSSRVRRLIGQGHVDQARRLLTQPYRVRGMVTHGAGRGARLGFPTANVDAVDTLLPGTGVYAGRAYALGQVWPAAVNVGANPTFGEHAFKVEAHLIGADVELYGQPLEVDFLRRLRDVHPFAGVEALRDQLERDVEAARRYCQQEACREASCS